MPFEKVTLLHVLRISFNLGHYGLNVGHSWKLCILLAGGLSFFKETKMDGGWDDKIENIYPCLFAFMESKTSH